MQSCVVHLSVRLSVCKHFAQIASSTRQMAGSPPNLHTMVPSPACIQDVLKVKIEVKGHVIWALLYSTVLRSVSTCTHFMKHHYTLFQYKCQAAESNV